MVLYVYIGMKNNRTIKLHRSPFMNDKTTNSLEFLNLGNTTLVWMTLSKRYTISDVRKSKMSNTNDIKKVDRQTLSN